MSKVESTNHIKDTELPYLWKIKVCFHLATMSNDTHCVSTFYTVQNLKYLTESGSITTKNHLVIIVHVMLLV